MKIWLALGNETVGNMKIDLTTGETIFVVCVVLAAAVIALAACKKP